MNSKLCKKLRKTACVMAASYGNGEPLVDRQLIEIEKNRKKTISVKRDDQGLTVVDEFGKPQYDIVEIALGTHVQIQTTVRGIYRRLKKVAKYGSTTPVSVQTAS